jgi:hypothetical protein
MSRVQIPEAVHHKASSQVEVARIHLAAEEDREIMVVQGMDNGCFERKSLAGEASMGDPVVVVEEEDRMVGSEDRHVVSGIVEGVEDGAFLDACLLPFRRGLDDVDRLDRLYGGLWEGADLRRVEVDFVPWVVVLVEEDFERNRPLNRPVVGDLE